PRLGKLMLTKIEAADIQSLYTSLGEQGLAPGTLSLIHTLIQSAFKLAVKRRKIAFNPMDGVTTPSKGRKVREPHAMTWEELTRFLEKAETTRFGVFFVLAFHTGCRPGELLALKWGDLDTSARTLKIQRTIAWRSPEDWYLNDPKTPLSRRTLPLTDGLVEKLAQHRTRQLEERLKAGKSWADHGFIFADEIGGPYS